MAGKPWDVAAVDAAYLEIKTARRPGMSTGWANRNKGRDAFTHERLADDNESTRCGSREGAASLDLNEVNCPRCRELRAQGRVHNA